MILVKMEDTRYHKTCVCLQEGYNPGVSELWPMACLLFLYGQ